MHNVEPMWHYVETIWHYVETHNTFGWVATFPAECGWLEPTRHISFAPIIRWSRSWESDSQSRNRNIANANSKAQLGLQELNTNFRFVWRAGKQTGKQASKQAGGGASVTKKEMLLEQHTEGWMPEGATAALCECGPWLLIYNWIQTIVGALHALTFAYIQKAAGIGPFTISNQQADCA